VISIPGMDSFKEVMVALYGDRWPTVASRCLQLTDR
jgi:hypothetical protein